MVCSFAVGTAFAQDYPTKPIRLIVPTPPAGSTDTTARIIAEKLAVVLGQPVLVENRPGADGRIGTALVAKAAPDGYTILMAYNGPISVAPSLFANLPYDPMKDLEPITLAGVSTDFLVVHPSLPVKSVAELVQLAKSRPGKLNYGTSGAGTTTHIDAEQFKSAAGIDIMPIMFKGSGDLMPAILGGHVDMAFSSVASSIPHIKAGSLRALAIASAKRSPLAPDVPTMVESGFPGIVTYIWIGAFAPAGTPRQIVAKLNTEIAKTLKMPDVVERMQRSGLEPSPSLPEEFAEFVKSDSAMWAKGLKAVGMQPQ